jgi:hypothetical protein
MKYDTIKAVDAHITKQGWTTNSFSAPKATLYGIDSIGDLEPIVDIIDSQGDVYELLEDVENASKLTTYSGFAVSTCGWAAPLKENGEENDVAPSKHPERKRVRLLTLCKGMKLELLIQFEGEDDFSFDDPVGGSLAVAMKQMWAISRVMKNIKEKASE